MTQLDDALQALSLPPTLAEPLGRLRDLFGTWNQKINLSASRTPAEVEEHLIDSLHVVATLAPFARAIDVGSGGGFPVLVAALALPNTTFTALEPVHKKHAFLRTAARTLDLVNLTAIAQRVEDHDVRDYDVATSRATFDLAEWLTIGASLVRPGGTVVGFEAIERTDLPATVVRQVYQLSGKRRAIVVFQP